MNIMTVFFFFFLSCSSYIIHSHFATMSHWYVYNLRYYDNNNNKNKLMNFFFFFTYRYITSGKSWMERWLREYLFSSSLLQIGLKRIRFHCMINLTWPINVQITILDIQIMFRFSRNTNSNLFQLTFPDFLFHSCFPCLHCS